MNLSDVKVGDRIKFAEEAQSYKVQARSENFIVCNKPFNPKKTTLYCIIDIKNGIRGPENLLFGAGAETQQQCEEMILRLESKDPNMSWGTEVSYRNRIPVKIDKIIPATQS